MCFLFSLSVLLLFLSTPHPELDNNSDTRLKGNPVVFNLNQLRLDMVIIITYLGTKEDELPPRFAYQKSPLHRWVFCFLLI